MLRAAGAAKVRDAAAHRRPAGSRPGPLRTGRVVHRSTGPGVAARSHKVGSASTPGPAARAAGRRAPPALREDDMDSTDNPTETAPGDSAGDATAPRSRWAAAQPWVTLVARVALAGILGFAAYTKLPVALSIQSVEAYDLFPDPVNEFIGRSEEH